MTKYDVLFSCGHIEERQIYGSRSQRASFLKIAAKSRNCQACDDAAEMAFIAAKEADLGLPDLTGTERQIKWARKLRSAAIARTDLMGKAGQALCQMTDASWWIDNRYESVERQEHFALLEIAAAAESAEAEECAAIEASDILKPSGTPILAVPVEVRINGRFIEMHHPERNEEITALAYQFRAKLAADTYDRRFSHWRIEVNTLSGDKAHIAAHLAHCLLAKGFITEVKDPQVRELCISGLFEPFRGRHVTMVYSRKGRLMARLTWPRSDDLYKLAYTLPGAVYVNGGMQVPAKFIESVADFAATQDFVLSEASQRCLTRHKEALAQGQIAEPQTARNRKKSDETAQGNEMTVPDDYDIDRDLIDADL